MMRDEQGMSLLAAETERWFWRSQFYCQCECCGLWGHYDDEFTDDPKREACNGCAKEMAIEAETERA